MPYRWNPLPPRFDRVDGGSPIADVETLSGDVGTNPVGPNGAFNIDILGGSTTTFDLDGIRTSGDAAANTLNIQLTNVASGSATTVGAVTADLITFSMGATPRACVFDIRVVGFETSTPAAVGYQIFTTVLTDGAAATLIDVPDQVVNESVVLANAEVNIVISGNNAIIRVTGVAGFTINWVSQFIYTQAT